MTSFSQHFSILYGAPKPAVLHLDGWEGRTTQPVNVIGETPTRYRITPINDKPVRLAGPRRVEPGASALVPQRSITFVDEGWAAIK